MFAKTEEIKKLEYQTLFACAIEMRNIEDIRYCLKKTFDPMEALFFKHDGSIWSIPPIQKATLNGDVEIVRLLLTDSRVAKSNQLPQSIDSAKLLFANTEELRYKKIVTILTAFHSVQVRIHPILSTQAHTNKEYGFFQLPEEIKNQIEEYLLALNTEHFDF
jgi:hypothetical protein